jgi:hypothetical protein
MVFIVDPKEAMRIASEVVACCQILIDEAIDKL